MNSPTSGESIIDPELEICDPHHHLWYPADGGYSLEDFRIDISGGHRITQTVFIESRKMLRLDDLVEMQPVGETEFVRDLVISSGNSGIVNGIVGFADLTLGAAVAPVLEAHIAAGGNLFKGVRYSTTWDASPEFRRSATEDIMSNPDFRKGFAALAQYNLSFDAWLYYPQLPELVEVARTFPTTRIVICHCGGLLGTGPYRLRHKIAVENWKKSVQKLAHFENVFIKLGGLGMDISGFDWQNYPQPTRPDELAKQFAPYFTWCIECFGVRRCMFESNFPVDKKAYSYTSLWNAFKIFAASFSASEKRALFHDTAASFYRLPKTS